MPSFDIVSEIDAHELQNAVDQARREIDNRFDFKGTGSRIELAEGEILLESESEFQLNQMMDILRNKLVKRGIDLACLDPRPVESPGGRARQRVLLRQGIDKDTARRIVKQVKDTRLKVQAAIQGEQVRVTGKKRDDLQQVIAALRQADLGLPLQFVNFRD